MEEKQKIKRGRKKKDTIGDLLNYISIGELNLTTATLVHVGKDPLVFFVPVQLERVFSLKTNGPVDYLRQELTINGEKRVVIDGKIINSKVRGKNIQVELDNKTAETLQLIGSLDNAVESTPDDELPSDEEIINHLSVIISTVDGLSQIYIPLIWIMRYFDFCETVKPGLGTRLKETFFKCKDPTVVSYDLTDMRNGIVSIIVSGKDLVSDEVNNFKVPYHGFLNVGFYPHLLK